MQATRLFEITYLLLNKERVTAKELADRFEVSTRTIYRDIDTLSSAGIPVYTEKGKGGGISLLPDFVLSKSILSEREQGEILSALHGLSTITTAQTDHIAQKLSAIFNKTATNWLDVDFADWGFSEEDIWGSLKTAILERRMAEFDYYSSYSEKTRRRVEPIQLWFKTRAWYLKGFCLAKQDVRVFKLLRIKGLVVTQEVFEDRDLSPSTPHEAASFENGKFDISLKIRISPEMTHRVLDEFAEVAEQCADGSFIVTVNWQEDSWLYGMILSFGEHVEVLEPAHLRDIIKEKAKKIAEKYL